MVIGVDDTLDGITKDYSGCDEGVLRGLILSKHGMYSHGRNCSSVHAQIEGSANGVGICFACFGALQNKVLPVHALARGFWLGENV